MAKVRVTVKSGSTVNVNVLIVSQPVVVLFTVSIIVDALVNR